VLDTNDQRATALLSRATALKFCRQFLVEKQNMNTKLNPSIALAAAGCLAFTTVAAAGITSFFSQPDWVAAAGGTNSLTVFAFQGPAETGGKFANDPSIAPSYAGQGVVFLPFTGTTNYPVIARGQQYQITAPNHDGLLANNSSPNPTSDLEGRAIKFSFNVPVRSVGVFFNGPISGGDCGYLEAFDTFGNLIGQTPVCAAGGFAGLVSDAPVTEVHVVNTGNADITFGIWDLQFVSAFGPSCASPPVGLVGWWPGDGTARDLAGGNNGTAVGGVTFAPGKVGPAFSLDGASGYVMVPTAANIDTVTSFTVLAWVYPTAESGAPDKVGMILNKETGALEPTAVQYEMGRRNSVLNTDGLQHISPGNLAFYIGGVNGLPNEGGGWVDGYAALPLGVWTHVALTFDGSVVRAYTNGVVTRQLTVTGLPISTNGTLRIGARTFAPPESCWAGMIDEPAVFNRALTAAEIQSMFGAGSLGMCKPFSALPHPAGTGFNFGFQSVSNQSYTIQRNDDLATANWIFYTNFTGNGSLMQLVTPVTNVPQRFFRVRQP
jgi:hypothetical protein